MKKTILVYKTEEGKEPFTDWLNALWKKDKRSFKRIESRLDRIVKEGVYGDCKVIGEGVKELRFFFGSGYRIYFGEDGDTIVLLLCGGDKETQQYDIQKAKAYWRLYNE